MMEVSTFYVTLPSNSFHSSRINVPGKFAIELPQELKFDTGKWEVALVETDIPISWYNVPEHPEQNRIVSIVREYFKVDPARKEVGVSRWEDIVDNTISLLARKIPFGNYDGARSLVGVVNDILKKRDDEKQINFTNILRRTHLKIDPQNLRPELYVAPGDKVYLSLELAQILRLDQCFNYSHYVRIENEIMIFEGFPITYDSNADNKGRLKIINKIMVTHHSSSDYPYMIFRACAVPNFNAHVSNLYIYSNIVDYEISGNVFTQLLKTVRGTGKFGEDIKLMYSRPQYKKVASRNIKEIEIEIRDDQGKIVEFQYGKVTLILHFRIIKKR